MRRRTLSPKERARLFVLHGGRCHLCTRLIVPGEKWEIEHVKALGLNGADDDANMKPAHVDCHKPKSAADVGMIAKADRMRAAHLGAKPRRSRPVPGSRASGWKKTVNHGWIRRDQT